MVEEKQDVLEYKLDWKGKGVISVIGRIILHLNHLYKCTCDHLNEMLA